MVIHVVSPGDTLWGISSRYGVSVQQIIDINGLQNIPYLIVGQALIIPTTETRYVVQRGDTLWSISRKFNVSMDSIIQLNNITNPSLIYPGMVLRIPQGTSPVPDMTIDVLGYVVAGNQTENVRVVDQLGEYLTYVAISSYSVNVDGTINPVLDQAVIDEAKSENVAPLLSITNMGQSNYDPDLTRQILLDESIQLTLFNNILAALQSKGYYGLHINFERVYPEDRPLYNAFVARAVEFFHQYNYPVSTALVAKTYDQTTGEWWGAHDYKTLGELVDFVLLMTYEFGCAFCLPGAVAPIPKVREVLDYAVSVIPREKILMGIPLYGYDWRLPFVSGRRATSVDYIKALQLAARYGVAIQYDPVAQSPFFKYIDGNGVQHEVWFEDVRSLMAKYNLVKEYGIAGVGYWSLSFAAPQNWPLLTSMFNVNKLI